MLKKCVRYYVPVCESLKGIWVGVQVFVMYLDPLTGFERVLYVRCTV